MKHPKLLTDFNQTTGKTVAEAVSDYDEVWIRFTDGTAIIVRLMNVGDDSDANMEIEDDPSASALNCVGLLTLDEFETARQEQQRELSAAREERDRAEFERLRAKFETSEAKPTA